MYILVKLFCSIGIKNQTTAMQNIHTLVSSFSLSFTLLEVMFGPKKRNSLLHYPLKFDHVNVGSLISYTLAETKWNFEQRRSFS